MKKCVSVGIKQAGRGMKAFVLKGVVLGKEQITMNKIAKISKLMIQDICRCVYGNVKDSYTNFFCLVN